MRRPLTILFLMLAMSTLAFAQPAPRISTALEPATLTPGADAKLIVTVEVPLGYHAQSDKPLTPNLRPFIVQANAGGGLRADAPVYPKGQLKTYPVIGPMSVYAGRVVTTVPLHVAADAKTDQLQLSVSVTYQICDDTGRCLRPETKTVLVLGSAAPSVAGGPATAPALGSGSPPGEAAAPNAAAAPTVGLLGFSVSITSIWIAIPIGMVVGLLFNVMPCVLPILPLKAMGFYQASQHQRGRALAFGVMFSAGLVAVFVALALFVIFSRSLLGQQFQWGQWFAIGWFVWAMTILLVLLGLGMLGAFSFRLPNSLYAFEFSHDTMRGNFMWGMLTAVLSTPCTAPMFAGLIGWAIGQNLVIGMLVMLSVGIGMALPYLILSAFPELARRFPRTGPASELVKQAMAFPLFATAAWLIGPRLVGDPNHYWLVVAVIAWGALFVLIRAAQILKSSGGVLVTTAFSTVIVGACVMLAIEMSRKIEWQPYSDEALAAARATGRPVVVKFTAAWCANCQWIEHTVFAKSETLEALRQRNVILIKADLTRDDAPGWSQLNALGHTGIPLTAIYAPASKEPRLFDSIYTEHNLLEALPAATPALSVAR